MTDTQTSEQGGEKKPKTNYYEVKVVVWEYYYVEAKHELGAYMTNLEDPAKIVVKRKIIKKVKK